MHRAGRLTELLTVLNSYDLTCAKIDRQEIGDQHHLYHHMNGIQITQKFLTKVFHKLLYAIWWKYFTSCSVRSSSLMSSLLQLLWRQSHSYQVNSVQLGSRIILSWLVILIQLLLMAIIAYRNMVLVVAIWTIFGLHLLQPKSVRRKSYVALWSHILKNLLADSHSWWREKRGAIVSTFRRKVSSDYQDWYGEKL